MRVYDFNDREGRLANFEIDSTFFDREAVGSVVSAIPGVQNVRTTHNVNRSSWIPEDEFCEFELDGVIFAVSESSSSDHRYWIGPVAPTGWAAQISIVREAFARADSRQTSR
jgi:hypothetical protein